MREQTSPGVWTDMGPQPAIRHVHGFSTLGGSIVTSRKAPMLGIQTTGEMIRHRRQMERRSGQRADYQKAARCGAAGVQSGEPCARMSGHKDCHRSAELMARDNERRRKWAR